MNQNKQSQLYSAEALRLNSHKTMRKLFLAVFAFFMTATLTFLITQNMKNTNAASFQAGNIMSDAVMGNYNSMSEADIQNFLKSKNSCNKYSSSAGDYSETYGSKTYTWHVRNHRYVCMADDTFNGESAAHIIYTVAHEYRINPQVLIVLLQKEQGLITDQFPNSWQYNKAAGFGCPDTAPCDAQYYGLRTQLSKAANLFRTVLDGGWSNYPVGNNYVQYHPNQACGGSVINIENRATSALYRYTPYQPNGALLCGGSDGCSSYGNYNFYKYFTDWFGDTHAIKDEKISSVYLPNDTFIFATTANTAMSFEGTGNGSQAIISARNDGDTLQQFTAIRSGDYYMFKNVASGRFLDLDGANASNGTKIHLWDGNNSCAQKWTVEITGDNSYRLRAACSKYFSLDITGGGSAIATYGTKIESWSNHNGDAQKWILTSVSPQVVDTSAYNIVSEGNKSINLANGNTNNGTKVTTGPIHTGKIDQYVFVRNQAGYYYIKNVATGRNLDVNGASTNNGTVVQNWDANTTCAQRWIVQKNGNTYRFISACSNKSLDITGGGDNIRKNGIKIEIWDSNNSSAQRLTLRKPLSNQIDTNKEYAILSKANQGMAVDIFGATPIAPGSNVQLFQRHNGANQRFKFSYDSNTGQYQITNSFSNTNLDVYEGYKANNSNAEVWSKHTQCAQNWVLSDMGNNSYEVINTCGMKALDIYNGNISNSSNIIVFTPHDGINQQWTIQSL